MVDFKDIRSNYNKRCLLRELHSVFGLQYGRGEDGKWEVLSDHPDWRVNPFLELVAELCQQQIAEHVEEIRKAQANKDASKLIGGPFDGEQIEVSLGGGTICRKVRHAWWAVYKRPVGKFPAMFVGFATSEFKGRHYMLSHATPAAEIKPLHQAEK